MAEEKLRWEKTSHGVHLHGDGQEVRKGEILYAAESEMTERLKKRFRCLDKPTEEQIAAFSGGAVLRVAKNEDGEGYSLINTITGDVLNEEPLSKDEAVKFGYIGPEEDEGDDADEKEAADEKEKAAPAPKKKAKKKVVKKKKTAKASK